MDEKLSNPDVFQIEAAEGWLTLRNWREAKAELDQITSETSRKHPDVLKAYADIWEVSSDHAAMIRYMEVLILYEPDEVGHWLRLNAALLFAGRYDEAYERMKNVLKAHPQHPALLFKLAVTCGYLGKIEEATWTLAELFALEGGKYESTYLHMALSWPGLESLRPELQALQLRIQKPASNIESETDDGESTDYR